MCATYRESFKRLLLKWHLQKKRKKTPSFPLQQTSSHTFLDRFLSTLLQRISRDHLNCLINTQLLLKLTIGRRQRIVSLISLLYSFQTLFSHVLAHFKTLILLPVKRNLLVKSKETKICQSMNNFGLMCGWNKYIYNFFLNSKIQINCSLKVSR